MKKKIVKILGVSLTVVLLVSLMLTTVVTATVSQPKVTVTPNAISTAAEYVIKFDSYFAMSGTSTIDVVFPANTTVPSSYTAGSIQVSNDGGTTYVAAVTAVPTPSTRTWVITVPAGATTTAPAHMAVKFLTSPASGVINPSTPGDYTLQVATSEETAKVESDSYTIGIPGVVTRYNKDGNYVGSYMDLQSALNVCNSEDRLMVGSGTYTTAVTSLVADKLTIEGVGADDSIIKAAVTIDQPYADISGLTFKGVVTITAAGDDVTIQDCTFEKASKTAGEVLLTTSGDRLELADCLIDTTYSDKNDTGIAVAAGDSVAIKDCTFTTDDGSGVSPMDKAIDVTATSAVTKLEVKNCAFTGTKGSAYYDAATNQSTSTVKDNTFDGYEKTIWIGNTVSTTTLTVQNNSIMNNSSKSGGAIDIDGANDLVIVGTTIEDSDGYSVHVDADAAEVVIIGSNLINNTKGLMNNTTTTLDAHNNWWGDASGPSGEGTGTGDAVSTYVTYKPYLAAATEAGQAKMGATSLDGEKAVGVKVENLGGTATLIWVGKYASNPKTEDPKYSALAGTWYDVFIEGGASPGTIKLYGDGITKNTDAYVWSGLESKWVACSTQGASASGGYVWVTVTTTSTPAYGDLSELPFVLVAAPAAAPPTFSLMAPEAGADTGLTNVAFTWASVEEAETYELVISANADLSSPMVKVSTAGTAYTYTGTLTDGTPYYWQVQALKDTEVKGKSDVGTFIAKAPVEPTPPVVIEPAPTPVIEPVVEIPPSPITPGIIWGIIAIGAILVIAVIVLIVRTRRVT